VTLPRAALVMMVGDRHQNDSHPAKPCQASFWPFDVLLLRLRLTGKVFSGITSIRYHRVEGRTMLHKFFFYRGLTGLQLTMQQGNERTRVKSRTSRLDSRALDGSKTNRFIHMLLRTYKPFRVYHSPYLLHRHTLDAGRIVYVKLIPRTQLTASCQLLRSLRCLE
jgi:hypothetical protein